MSVFRAYLSVPALSEIISSHQCQGQQIIFMKNGVPSLDRVTQHTHQTSVTDFMYLRKDKVVPVVN
jgi:hypothetical protein